MSHAGVGYTHTSGLHTRKLGHDTLGRPRTGFSWPVAVDGLVPNGVHRARLEVALALDSLQKLERQGALAASARECRLPRVLEEVVEVLHARPPAQAKPQLLKAALFSSARQAANMELCWLQKVQVGSRGRAHRSEEAAIRELLRRILESKHDISDCVRAHALRLIRV